MKTSVYVDGFNLYYGCLKGTPYKWLDLKSLCELLLDERHVITRIKYFTAKVTSPSFDPQKTTRQLTYIRALKHCIPEFEFYFGHFLSHKVSMPLANPTKDKPYEYVIKTEEKGSDVNLAVHLVNDAWLNVYECAVVISNDSDLSEAWRIVKTRNKKLGVITPHKNRQSKELIKHCDFNKRIRSGALGLSQLPFIIPGTTIHKPPSW